MVEILTMNEIATKEENAQKDCPEVNKIIMKMIMENPIKCLSDDNFMLTYVVDNGINAALLCEALDVSDLTFEINGKKYKIGYCKPSNDFKHSDVMFNTKTFKDAKNKRVGPQELEAIFKQKPLPKNVVEKI